MSRRFLFSAIALTMVACSEPLSGPNSPAPNRSTLTPGAAPLYTAAPGKTIRDEYIVVFRDDMTDDVVDEAARLKAEKHGAKKHWTFKKVLKGFAATLTPAAVDDLRNDPDVAYIEEDQEVT